MTRRQQLFAFTKIVRAATLVSVVDGSPAHRARMLLDEVVAEIEGSLAKALVRRRRGRRS